MVFNGNVAAPDCGIGITVCRGKKSIRTGKSKQIYDREGSEEFIPQDR
jgi:hypothetical protein